MNKNKRKSIKSISALGLWTTPIVTAISLPAHAEMTCDKELRIISSPLGFCSNDNIYFHLDYLLSDHFGAQANLEVLNVTSNNPKVIIDWQWYNPHLRIVTREFLPQECAKLAINNAHPTGEEYSPHIITIKTTCDPINFT
ncbi:MAG: hypothetical protein V3V09_09685 [Arenicellales bacterium]